MYIIAVHTKAMHTIPIALYIKCTYLVAMYIALRPNTPGQLEVQWSSIAMTASNYSSSKFKGQTSLCPPETISAQSSKDKCRYVRQKLYQLKVQRANVAMSARNYVSSKLNGQTSLCPPETISAQSSKDTSTQIYMVLFW